MILAIETSCDDSAIALIGPRGEILFEALSSQIDLHAKYGGVVPEIASRKHLISLSFLLHELEAHPAFDPEKIRAIAVTQSPGLVGSVLVGLSWAKGLSWAWKKPLIAVDHLEGHLLAPFLDHPDLEYPYLGLIASGGHTHLVYVEGLGDYRLLGRTMDDALGEAYDKVAKMLGFEYPGGPIVDAIASNATTASIKFPIPLLRRKTFNFSFSGLKTAVRNEAIKLNLRVEHSKLLRYDDYLQMEPEKKALIEDLCNSFQQCCAQIVANRFEQAIKILQPKRLVLTGGVAANLGIRAKLSELAKRKGAVLYCPTPAHCTDNGAMIGQVAFQYLSKNKGICPDPLSLAASPKSTLGLMEIDPMFDLEKQ